MRAANAKPEVTDPDVVMAADPLIATLPVTSPAHMTVMVLIPAIVTWLVTGR
jgi:hypothetical protein